MRHKQTCQAGAAFIKMQKYSEKVLLLIKKVVKFTDNYYNESNTSFLYNIYITLKKNSPFYPGWSDYEQAAKMEY